MKRITPVLCLFALTLLLTPATALAGEPLPQLKGSWLAESYAGKKPDKGTKITLVFIDDSKLSMQYKTKNGVRKTLTKYKATADGTFIFYPDPKVSPKDKGQKAKWEVKSDKNLYITTEDGKVLIFSKIEAKEKPKK